MSADHNIMSGFYEGVWIAIKMFMASSVFPVIDPDCKYTKNVNDKSSERLGSQNIRFVMKRTASEMTTYVEKKKTPQPRNMIAEKGCFKS